MNMRKRTSARPRHPPDLFEKAAIALMDRLHPDRMDGSGMKLNRDLMALSGGRKEAVREYYIEKIRIMLKLFSAAVIAAIALLAGSFVQNNSIPDGKIERPGYGELSRSEDLVVQFKEDIAGSSGNEYNENEESNKNEDGLVKGNGAAADEKGKKTAREILQVEIESRKYTADQVEKLLSDAENEAFEIMLGENDSADHIRTSMVFPKTLAGGSVRAEWMTMPYGVIEEDGSIAGDIDENGTVVSIECELECQERKKTLESAVRVYPPEKTEAEAARNAVDNAVRNADQKSASEDYIQLPEEIEGISVRWFYAKDYTGVIAAMLILILPFLFYEMQNQRILQMAQQRRAQLEMDYPDVMWKMTLLIGAGMNLSSAFARIADDYRRERDTQDRRNKRNKQSDKRDLLRKRSGGKLVRYRSEEREECRERKNNDRKGHQNIGTGRYVYEEMLITCNEIRDGVSEGKAYENFGHRCGLPRYIRLGSILSQNLRKGSRGLAQVLEQEALSSSQERRAQARKLGEKAGTKLLLPMVMMMCVVFVILIAPAFLNM